MSSKTEIWVRQVPQLVGDSWPAMRTVQYDEQDRVILTREQHEKLLKLAKYKRATDDLKPKEPRKEEPKK